MVNENYFTVRGDQRISDKDSLFGTYVYDYSPLTQPDIFNNVLQQSIAKRQIAAIEENHIFGPTASNSFRLGYNRDHDKCPSGDQSPQSSGRRYNSRVGARVRSAPNHLLQLNTTPGFAPPTFAYAWNAYQVYDDAFMTKGLHTFKFGVGVERDQLNETTATADYLGTFKFRVDGNVPDRTIPKVSSVLFQDWSLRDICGSPLSVPIFRTIGASALG